MVNPSSPEISPHEVAALIAAAADLEITVDATDARRLLQLRDQILRFNKRVNLVAPCSASEALERHVLDSLALRRLLDRRSELVPTADPAVIYDVGSGGGFPGLVVALSYPDAHVHMVEPISKKGALVRQAARSLGLTNVTMHTCRLDAMDPPQGPAWAISRATFAPEEWARLGACFVGSGGAVVVMQGGDKVVEASATVATDTIELPSGSGRTNTIILA